MAVMAELAVEAIKRILARNSVGLIMGSLIAWSTASPNLADAAVPYKFTNKLIDSNDPYLLLHAHNPVDWYPWGPEAFAKARKENKPIFISIGYSTCYWCHVAERTIYSNPDIAKLMNQWFRYAGPQAFFWGSLFPAERRSRGGPGISDYTGFNQSRRDIGSSQSAERRQKRHDRNAPRAVGHDRQCLSPNRSRRVDG